MATITMTLHQAQRAQAGLLPLPMCGVHSTSPIPDAGAMSPLEQAEAYTRVPMQRKRSREQAFEQQSNDRPVLYSPLSERSCASTQSYMESPSDLVRTRKRMGQLMDEAQRARQSQQTVCRLMQGARLCDEQPFLGAIRSCTSCGVVQGNLIDCAVCVSAVCRICSMTLYYEGDSVDACFDCAHGGDAR